LHKEKSPADRRKDQKWEVKKKLMCSKGNDTGLREIGEINLPERGDAAISGKERKIGQSKRRTPEGELQEKRARQRVIGVGSEA